MNRAKLLPRTGPALLRALIALLAVAVVAGMAGCFESEHPLSPRDPKQKLDPRLLGEWTLEQLNQDGQVDLTHLVVLNLRGEEYFIEWITGGDDHFRAVGHLSEVNGVSFVNLLPLSDSLATAQQKYTIMRIDFDGTRLKIRDLSGDFFKDKKFDSSESLRQIVAANLENEQMYLGEPLYGKKREK